MMSRKPISHVVGALLCATLIGCNEQAPTSPHVVPKGSAAHRMIALNDPCWIGPDQACNDQTSVGALIAADQYNYLGGFDPCYSGLEYSCGSGFGNWTAQDDAYGGGPCTTYLGGPCLLVGGATKVGWRGCPLHISFSSYNIVTMHTEYWWMDLVSPYINNVGGANVMMAHYAGYQNALGVINDTAKGEMVCSVGFLAYAAILE